ncbi:hypothetical protein V8G54_010999 [Vigna mungo]|uniref:Beta-galactosidase n=1 Tax=Vigna mungo TaxID=3915 RepID=A0AAQ3NRT2_VIGMU
MEEGRLPWDRRGEEMENRVGAWENRVSALEERFDSMEATLEEIRAERNINRDRGRRRNQRRSSEGSRDSVNAKREWRPPENSEDEVEEDRGDVQCSWMQRVELPTFEGAEIFFDQQNMTEREKMKLVYICMERGASYYWIRFWWKKTRHPAWKMFTDALTRRFGGVNRSTVCEKMAEGSVNTGGGQEDKEDEEINNLLDLEDMGKGMGEKELKLSTHQLPLLIQCRLFHMDCTIKGTLLVNKKLLPRTIQIENEYGYYENFYKEDGKKYALWAAKMAVSPNTGVPWIMCQQWHAPNPVIDTCNSFYCDDKNDRTVEFRNTSYRLPAWSVSILPDCKNVVFNTAKVNSQTNVVAMIPGSLQQSNKGVNSLIWDIVKEKPRIWGTIDFVKNGFVDFINTTKDTTDYLWHTTSIFVGENEEFLKKGSKPVLLIESTGHALHAFVNQEYQVGLQTAGPFYDFVGAGLRSVKIKGLNNGTIDLSSYAWTYKIGVQGEHLKLYQGDGLSNVNWTSTSEPPKMQPLTWYKTIVHAPPGDEPVGLDMLNMGKGLAWLNGEFVESYITANKRIDAAGNILGCFCFLQVVMPDLNQSSEEHKPIGRENISESKELAYILQEIETMTLAWSLSQAEFVEGETEESDLTPNKDGPAEGRELLEALKDIKDHLLQAYSFEKVNQIRMEDIGGGSATTQASILELEGVTWDEEHYGK